MNAFLSKLANNEKASTVLIYAGIVLAGVAQVLIFSGAHYRGVHRGVEARDDYYYEREKEAYEKYYGGKQ